MLDPDLQQKFIKRCADAAFSYQAASTAAYAAFTDQVINFWSGVLQPAASKPSVPARQAAALPFANPFTTGSPFSPFAWALPQPSVPAAAPLPSLADPWKAMAAFAEAMSGALSNMSAMPVHTAATSANPMTAWLSAFPMAAPAAWPMAWMMMSNGVPHAVAWPTAEANVAVLDAADVARRSIKKAFASYQTESGHAGGGNVWPPAQMLTLMTAIPMNIGTFLSAMRLH